MAQIKSYVSDDLKEKIDKYCKERDISISAFIKLAAHELFKKEG